VRAMGVDFGSKRIGIAFGVDEPFVATSDRPALIPTGTLAKDAANLLALAKNEGADRIIVGIPMNEPDDRMAKVCKKLAELLREGGAKVEEVDESFSSVEAESNLIGTGLTAAGRRKLRDGEAARILLERYFERT
jgi:putative Holliday junction resolvase